MGIALPHRKWVWGWIIPGWAEKSIKVLFLEHLSFLTSLGGKKLGGDLSPQPSQWFEVPSN